MSNIKITITILPATRFELVTFRVWNEHSNHWVKQAYIFIIFIIAIYTKKEIKSIIKNIKIYILKFAKPKNKNNEKK